MDCLKCDKLEKQLLNCQNELDQQIRKCDNKWTETNKKLKQQLKDLKNVVDKKVMIITVQQNIITNLENCISDSRQIYYLEKQI